MTTDLRAALRDTATAWDALGMRAAQPECDSHPLVNPDHCAARARQLRALADAPPTVAESDAAKDRDAAKWRKVEPLIKRLCAFEDGPTDLRDLLTVALDVLAATKEPS